MTAEAIAMLIVRYGIPAAEAIWNTIRTATQGGKDPTPQEWAALRALVDNTIEQRLSG